MTYGDSGGGPSAVPADRNKPKPDALLRVIGALCLVVLSGICYYVRELRATSVSNCDKVTALTIEVGRLSWLIERQAQATAEAPALPAAPVVPYDPTETARPARPGGRRGELTEVPE